MENHLGKICPYCKTPITIYDTVKECPACGIPHHENCWNENHGCTTFGCSQQNYQAQNTNPTSVCSNCGAPMGDGQAFCTKCGTAKAAAPKKNFCTSCGNELAEGQSFCPNCGQRAGLAVDNTAAAAISQFNANIQQQKSKKKLTLPIILGGVAVVILVLFLLLRGPSVDEVILSKSALELKVGDTTSVSYTINPDEASDVDVTWKSSNESVATVSSNGKITGKGDGSCTITVTAGGKTDSLTVTVTSGPDFKALYNKYCKSTWANYGSDGSYLSIDTNPYDWDDDGLAYPEAYTAVKNIISELGMPSSLINDIGETSSADGKQVQTYGNVTVSWKYHPDKGLEITFKVS